MKTLKILMLLTSHAQLGASGKPTGFWLEELATPYYVFVDAGAEVTLASPQGGAAPADPRSTTDTPSDVKRFAADATAQKKLADTLALQGVDVTRFDAVFVVGGHGTMWDLPTPEVGAKLSAGWNAGRVLAAVCHGPAALVEVKDQAGRPVVAGRKVAAFSNDEEKAGGLENDMPFLLETKLTSLGAKYQKAPRWQSFTVTDGRLVTGQNPASSKATAEAVLKALR